ncbi:MAG: SEL1-like repeat protein [Planctomycetaceae bacterium]|jgi:TPR repeat protein|nr:SEL1-like repeat protein [Planctomycetaceae bacterium]
MLHLLKQFWMSWKKRSSVSDPPDGNSRFSPGKQTGRHPAEATPLRKNEPLLYEELIRRRQILLPESEHTKTEISRIHKLHAAAIQGNLDAVLDLGKSYLAGKHIAEDMFFAYRLIRFAAEQGLKNAYPILGKCYSRGLGTSCNPEKALHWFRKMPDPPDDPEILALFGWCYLHGAGLPKDKQKGFDNLVKAAESGHPDKLRFLHAAAVGGHARGQYILGVVYQHGQGIPADMQTALRWFLQSAEQGYADAQCRLGIIYMNGEDDVESDPAVAVQWFRLAANQNDTVARNLLAQCLIDGRGMEQDVDEAVKIWQELAKPSQKYPQGEAVSQYGLGQLLLNQEYHGCNPKEAVKWLRKSAQQGCVAAQVRLGICLYEGRVIARNVSEARTWFHKAAKKGDEDAQYYLGEIYAEGDGVPANRKESFRWYEKSADSGYVPAKQKLAHCQLHGIGTPKDENGGYLSLALLASQGDEEALTLLYSAAVSGNAAAEYGMFLYTVQKTDDVENARHWLESAAKKGIAKALCSLGILYDKENESEKKIHYWRLAADKGDAEAQIRLAMSLENYRDNKAPENAEAFERMKAAADQNRPDALYFLGNFYRDGIGTDADPEKAFICYMRAAEAGNSDGMERVASCFLNGEGIGQDAENAFFFFRISAEKGNPKGQYGFGLCCLNGIGCPQDMEVAFRWISLAAHSGHPAVIRQLESAGLDVAKLSGGYKQFHKQVSAMQGDRFGQNFEQAFRNENGMIKPIPPSKKLTQ